MISFFYEVHTKMCPRFGSCFEPLALYIASLQLSIYHVMKYINGMQSPDGCNLEDNNSYADGVSNLPGQSLP